MNTTLTRTTRHTTQQSGAERPWPEHPQRPARRAGLLDRAALHLGIALIRWGRRPGRALARYERLANVHERALLQREHDLVRQQLERERDHVLARLL